VNLETAIRAVVGRDASEDRVLAVARVLAERGLRQPRVREIEDAARAADTPPAGETLTTYNIDCTTPDDRRRTLRVRGASESAAIQGAHDYLARQWDGRGEVHADTLEAG
jgi:cobalamin biosynthesis protein CbiG